MAAPRPFDSFVILAAMRTGSNLLEESLNQIEGLTCHGEAFNPHFPGYPKNEELLGMTLAARDADPAEMLVRIRAGAGLNGFRFFPEHDPRALVAVLEDRRCAKIMLSRNPLDSYVSLKIARKTGQWRLRDAKHRRTAEVTFEPEEFAAYLDDLTAFQGEVMHALQTSGQTGFFVAYDDLTDTGVLAGLAAFLGVTGAELAAPKTLVKQNPEPVAERVANPEEMERALAALDPFALSHVPMFEPRRGAAVPTYIAAEEAGLLYLPIKAGPVARVGEWMAAASGGGLIHRLNRKSLRDWMDGHPVRRAFTVVRHPVARAHAAYCDHVLEGGYDAIRETLRKSYKLPLPQVQRVGNMTAEAHRAAFLAFARFLKANLAGQTSVRVDDAWASQSAVLHGFAQFVPPDIVAREDRLAEDLRFVAACVGLDAPDPAPAAEEPRPFALAEIYDAEIEAALAEAYARDYAAFGFGPWRG